MIAVEQTYDWILGKIKKVVGTKKTEDPEDPASLVGSFKRYKNWACFYNNLVLPNRTKKSAYRFQKQRLDR